MGLTLPLVPMKSLGTTGIHHSAGTDRIESGPAIMPVTVPTGPNSAGLGLHNNPNPCNPASKLAVDSVAFTVFLAHKIQIKYKNMTMFMLVRPFFQSIPSARRNRARVEALALAFALAWIKHPKAQN